MYRLQRGILKIKEYSSDVFSQKHVKFILQLANKHDIL